MERLDCSVNHKIREIQWLSIPIKDHKSLINVKDVYIEPSNRKHYWHHTGPCKARIDNILDIREFVETPKLRPPMLFYEFINRSTLCVSDFLIEA
jgi:hypothetical protein